MARLGVLRASDVRCLSATFFAVVVLCCVFLLALQPPQLPAKISVIDLPRDQVLRSVQTFPAHDGSPVMDDDAQSDDIASQKGEKLEDSKETKISDAHDKKEKKTKWYKDELPSNQKISLVREGVAPLLKEAEGAKGHNPLPPAPGRLNNAPDVPGSRVSPSKETSSNQKHVNREADAAKQEPLGQKQEAASGETVDADAASGMPALGAKEVPQSKVDGVVASKGTLEADEPNRHQIALEAKSSEVEGETPAKAKAKAAVAAQEHLKFMPDKNMAQLKASDGLITEGVALPFANLEQLPISSFASPFINTDKDILQPQVEKKVITWHFEDEAARDFSHMHRALEQCPDAACQLLYPVPPGAMADAVLFNTVRPKEPVPARISPDQAFVFRAMSSPASLATGGENWPQQWNSAFNWTWSYRRDSDIWQPEGMLNQAEKVRPQEYFAEVAKGKTRALAWMPMTCYDIKDDAPSNRQQFVAALRRYISITEFGPCVNKTCSDKGKGGRVSTTSSSCSALLTKKFFFILALEDDFCRDHVTEVFYRAWQDGTHVVPVVRGGADYAAYFPEGSFVDVDWFDTVKDLADFLTEMMQSPKLYAQLLWRKAHWVLGSGRRLEGAGLCQLCSKLHHLPATRKRYPDMRRWYEKGACKLPRPVT